MAWTKWVSLKLSLITLVLGVSLPIFITGSTGPPTYTKWIENPQEQADELLSALRADRFAEQRIQEVPKMNRKSREMNVENLGFLKGHVWYTVCIII